MLWMGPYSLDTETLRVALVDKPAVAGELQVEKPMDFEAKQPLASDRRYAYPTKNAAISYTSNALTEIVLKLHLF